MICAVRLVRDEVGSQGAEMPYWTARLFVYADGSRQVYEWHTWKELDVKEVSEFLRGLGVEYQEDRVVEQDVSGKTVLYRKENSLVARLITWID